MHELTWSAWLLIMVSTLPWLVMTAVYYVANFNAARPGDAGRDELS